MSKRSKGKKVAIVGFSKTSYDDVPFDNPGWEKWGLAWDLNGWERYTRLFDMHHSILWEIMTANPLYEHYDGKGLERRVYRHKDYYDEWLPEMCQSKNHKVYLQEATLLGAIAYPFERVDREVGHYYCSSISYMVALAIVEAHITDIAIFGVDMAAGDEWQHQRANMEYLIGYARGKGIRVILPEKCPLTKFQDQADNYGASSVMYTDRYGNPKAPQTFKRRLDFSDSEIIHQVRRK